MRGRVDEAQRALNLYFRIDPQVTVAKICEYYPFHRRIDRERLMVAMRKAGVPE
jgi:hypothetical protein